MTRPVLPEKRHYVPEFAVEEFIVPLLRSRIESILASLPSPVDGARALDLGCGGQPFRRILEDRGYRYVSVDAQDPRGVVDFIAEIDRDLPPALLAKGPFDFILCTELLEHVADWNKAFQNIGLLLKQGGGALVTCPHFYVMHEVPFDFWRPTVYALRYYAERVGLTCVSLEKVGTSWDVLGTILGANLEAARATDRTFVNRALAYAIDTWTRTLFRVLKNRRLQRRVAWGTARHELYLSNVALLEKR
jgi:SAM-dependent methyltransferase